ncbi:MAG: branched-chain amino acid ABC transporter permease [Chloroflexota bacterium]|nr:MAG: branched-chain amino acid ABC transporter permease [Chloroflexota bacterium]
MVTLQKNRLQLITLAVIGVLFLTAVQSMEPRDWVITVMRGLSVGAITFLVAAGLSLIFGLMDVLNLAHGELFMLGAYVGWTVFVRPDTFVDVLPLLLLLAAGLLLTPLWESLLARLRLSSRLARFWPWLALGLSLAVLATAVPRYSISIWNPAVYTESPITYSLALEQGRLVLPEAPAANPLYLLLVIFLGMTLFAVAMAGFRQRRELGMRPTAVARRPLIFAIVLLVLGLLVHFGNDTLTAGLLNIGTTWRFFLAMAVATLVGVVLGGVVEVTMIRPLYSRPIYQLMLTLGLGFIIIEVVRSIWGRPEFTMPRAALFTGSGDGCPATSLADLLAHQCSTVILFDGRLRSYNEIFIVLVGLIVLVTVWFVLQRTRIGMVIRAGVQDSEMVEALGINVRQVFTLVFAMGVGLAAMGGVLAAPSVGLSPDIGTRFLLLALIALAIGGLTSFPGAAAGAVLVGLLQQFIIKYGQIGINLPFLAEPFKPSPPLVPASVVLLMVIILLVLPNGLFGRNE